MAISIDCHTLLQVLQCQQLDPINKAFVDRFFDENSDEDQVDNTQAL